MPAGIFLIWPALHLMFGVSEVYSNRVPAQRRLAGNFLLVISALLISQPYGWEQGLFYWLFALMALGLVFVQLRIWQSRVVLIGSGISLALLVALLVTLFVDQGSRS